MVSELAPGGTPSTAYQQGGCCPSAAAAGGSMPAPVQDCCRPVPDNSQQSVRQCASAANSGLVLPGLLFPRCYCDWWAGHCCSESPLFSLTVSELAAPSASGSKAWSGNTSLNRGSFLRR